MVMRQHLPFYMTYGIQYPGQNIWDDDYLLQRDYDYMKSVYPDNAKRIMPLIEEECDRLEYRGSMMFDEYPDQLQLRLLCNRIYRKMNSEDAYIYELIQVMTYHEIMKRRREYRKYYKKGF